MLIISGGVLGLLFGAYHFDEGYRDLYIVQKRWYVAALFALMFAKGIYDQAKLRRLEATEQRDPME